MKSMEVPALLASAVRPLAVGLAALEPDSTLHHVLVESGDGRTGLTDEGHGLLTEVAETARTKLATLNELEFRSDSVSVEMADDVAATRQAMTQLAWMLWAIEIALDYNIDRARPGRTMEAIAECARIASLTYAHTTFGADARCEG